MTRARCYTRRERELLAAALLSYRDEIDGFLSESETDETSRLHIDRQILVTLLGEFR